MIRINGSCYNQRMTSGTEENGEPPIKVQIQVELVPGETITVSIEATHTGEVTGAVQSTSPRETLSEGNVRILPEGIADRVQFRVAEPVAGTPSSTIPVGLPLARDGQARDFIPGLIQWWAAFRSNVTTLELGLFGFSLLTYLGTRLIGLVSFPIYFFTDEAVNTVLAADFIRDHFHNYDGDLFPTFFVNGGQYNLGPSVYLQIIPTLIFGKSVWVTRGVAVLVTLIAAVSIALILHLILKVRYWWVGTLVLSVIPAWFLHSRTAFETGMMVSFYAGFLLLYLLYRYRSPRYLYAALAFGGLVFYTYTPGEMIILVTGVFLLISDIRYHWKNWKTSVIGFGELLVLGIPYARFLITHGTENYRHLVLLGSYLIDDIPVIEKVRRFAMEYLQGFNLAYWYLPNNDDLSRHLMKGYGHLSWFTLPFLLVGLFICFKNIRSPAHRTILFAVLAAPSGAALVQMGITRALVMVIPVALLTTLGLAALLGWLEDIRVPKAGLAVSIFVLLAGFNIYMLRDALVNGPTWFNDYGLGGMQYGATQIFGEIQNTLKASPNTKIVLTPSWANGTDVVERFFMSDSDPVTLASIDGYIFERKPIDQNTLFILIPDEYQRMLDSKKFTDIKVEKIMNYPDGSPGFYFIHMRYVDNIDAILEAEKEARRALISESVMVGGKPATVRYSMLDMGPIANVFDGDPNTLARTLEANPFVIELAFPQPRSISGVTLRVGGTPTEVKASLQLAGGGQTLVFDQDFPETPLMKDVTLNFGQARQVTVLHLEIKNIYDGEPSHVHVWEVKLDE